MAYLLGIDIGTSGTKTAIFSETGDLIESAAVEYPLYQPQNGYAEQDPDDWWGAVQNSIKETVKKSGVNDISAIGLSGQMHGLVMLDKSGKHLSRSIIWCDQRTADECVEITTAVGAERLVEITANPALTGFTASKIMWVKIMWVKKHRPELYEKCAHILLPKDFIRFKLTGEFAAEVSDASGTQLLDVRNRCWSDEVLSKLGIDKSLLPKVFESPEISGRLCKKAAEALGLKAGIPVAGGAGDCAASAIGSGICEEKKAMTTIGTSGVVFAHTDKMLTDKKGRIHTFCHAVPGAWHVMGVTQSAGLSIKWLKENLNFASYKELDEAAADVLPGANRLIYLPYLMGERTPHLDPDARGVFFGLSASHTRKELARAVLEGVSFSLLDCYNVFRETGIETAEMTVCGGGGKSPVLRQILSDMFMLDIKVLRSDEGAALGAALIAGTGAGIYKDIHEACKTAVKVNNAETFDPKCRYEGYYRLYRELYANMKGSFKTLSKL